MDEKYIFLKPTFSTAIWGDGSLVHHYHVEKSLGSNSKVVTASERKNKIVARKKK